mgnify:FL=1
MTDPLHQAVLYLAGRCDGAVTKDDQGFMAMDTKFGHRLAGLPPAVWSPAMQAEAHAMLGKYRTQLAGGGIDYDAIPRPTLAPTPEARREAWALARDQERGRPLAPAETDPRRADVDEDRHELRLRFPYHEDVIARVRGVPGARWNKPAGAWVIPLSPASVTALRGFLADTRFPVAPEVLARLDAIEHDADARVEASQAAEATLEIPRFQLTLRPFQRAGALYGIRTQRCLIGDDMGLGKTIEALAILEALDAYPAVIVVPASVKLNWRREAQRCLPHHPVYVLDSTPLPDRIGEIGSRAIYIVNYDVLRAHVEPDPKQPPKGLQRLTPQAVVLDEIHYCKSSKALRTKLCRALCTTVPVRLGLTGTPILNRPLEILAPLAILGRLQELGGYWPLVRRFNFARQTRWGMQPAEGAHLEEFHRLLRATCYVRRRKADVLTELPPIVHSSIALELDNRAEYEHAEADLIGWLRAKVRQDEAFLDSVAHLGEPARVEAIRERENSVARTAERAEQLVRINALKRLTARGKLAAVKAWVEDFLESGEKLVLGAHHVEIVAALARAFHAPAITGATPIPDRQAAVDRFQTDPACRVIVCNLQAGGIGITLTAASNVACVELPWHPGGLDQFTGRCHRIGQVSSVTAWYLLGEATIDQEIAALIDEKRRVVDALTDGRAAEEDVSILAALVARLTGPKAEGRAPSAVDPPW